jgi:subtilisin family serine protease
VAVSATDSNDGRASFSSYGSYVSVSAPGQSIWTTIRGGSYGYVSGTSFSCPITAGVAALAASANPQLSNTQIVNLLKTTADDLGTGGYDVYFGYGRVNASRAVNAAGGSVVYDTTIPTVQIASPLNGSSINKNVKVSVAAQDNVGVARVELFINGVFFSSSTTVPVTFTWNALKAGSGQHTLQAFAYDAAGNKGASSIVTVIR